mmetsp:Transcript_67968/g.196831  ORF Transcript_67968/g.196831 Transcript_67968/m.196831 type:complete len:228 (-) Transcript_67968:141-824(-)
MAPTLKSHPWAQPHRAAASDDSAAFFDPKVLRRCGAGCASTAPAQLQTQKCACSATLPAHRRQTSSANGPRRPRADCGRDRPTAYHSGHVQRAWRVCLRAAVASCRQSLAHGREGLAQCLGRVLGGEVGQALAAFVRGRARGCLYVPTLLDQSQHYWRELHPLRGEVGPRLGAALVLLQQGMDVLTEFFGEGGLADTHEPHDQSEGVDVHAVRVAVLSHDLRRDIPA